MAKWHRHGVMPAWRSMALAYIARIGMAAKRHQWHQQYGMALA